MRFEQRPWWPELLALKDTHSLPQLAKRFGVSATGIAGALRRTETTRVKTPSQIETYAALVGVKSDGHVARLAGVSTSAVTQWRKRRGIVAASKRADGGSEGAPVRVADAPPQSRGRTARSGPGVRPTDPKLQAWRVELADGRVGYVVAPTIIEAGAAADAAGTAVAIRSEGALIA